MAQTTTALSACDAVIEVDNDAGTPVDISGSSNNASLSMTRDVGEATTFDGDYKIRTECKRDASMSLKAFWTTAAAEARATLEEWFDTGGKRTITVYPGGKVIGRRYYTGEFFLSGFDIAIDAGEAGPMSLDLEAVSSGAVGFLNVGS